MSDKHHRYYKHTKFRQNPRGDSKFLVDLTWNDPIAIYLVGTFDAVCVGLSVYKKVNEQASQK